MNKTTECPSCGCKYRVPQEFKGRKISCKKCGTQFQLTLPDESNQNMMAARETDSKLGMVIVKNDFATQEEVDQALQEQKKVFIDTKTVKSIGDILFESGVITEEEHDVVLAVQKRLKDAEIKYYFETDPLKIGTAKDGGVVDFEDKPAISQVKKDDLLVEKTPPVAGTPGKDVYGNRTDTPKFKDIKLRCGKGAALSEDGTKIIANTDGVPKISVHGKVYVLSQHEIRGDVGKNTGHVNFDGEINVTGSIRSGYRVQGHSLAVDTILGAEVEMIGDIIVSGGIIKAAIKTDGHVRARFVRGADIKAYGDVIVEKGIRDSEIETSGACIVKEGIILASKITAKKGIWAAQIGSEVSKPCGLIVGVDVRAKNEIDKIIPLIPSKKQDLKKLKSQEQELTKKSAQIENKIGELAQMQDRAMVEKRNIQTELEQFKEANDQVQIQSVETVLKDMDTENIEMEKKMGRLFDLQDQISEKIANINQEIEIVDVKVQKLEERVTEIMEWSSNGGGIPEVRVKGAIFPETKIDAEKSALTLKQSQKNVLIKEHKIQQRGKMSKWQMKISDLNI